MELTDKQLEDIRRQEFIRGYCAAYAEWTSGCVPAATLGHKAYEAYRKVKNASQSVEVQKT